MPRRGPEREVVYVERGGDSSAKWLFWGALLGAGVALLYAPSSGEETRRKLQRRLRKLRAMTEESLDELVTRYGPGKKGMRAALAELTGDDDLDDADEDGADEGESVRGRAPSPREELERRLAAARARRRATIPLADAEDDDEEPLA